MGTGHSVDTPIRVAPFGISSVISIVDDTLLEKIRRYYDRRFDLPHKAINRTQEDSRAKRITGYLETVREIVQLKMEAIKALPFFAENDKKKYFDLLPESSPLKRAYRQLLSMRAGTQRDEAEKGLTSQMEPGSIDVNIMVKIDKMNSDSKGRPLGEEFSDAKAALRGYALSSLNSCIVFSAGMNQALFNYITRFRDFYRNEIGEVKKRIIIKVSDFRSAMIQGKLLAKKGLEVHEFRIESGLNCGGHAFASNGILLPKLLQEFKEKRDLLTAEFRPLVQAYYAMMGWPYPPAAREERPLVTVQGGIGTHGEMSRLQKDFDMDRTGWASPFLLVPEATCVDDETRELLRQANEEDLYLSNVSPLGVPFNNIRESGSEKFTRLNAKIGKPGSSCPKGFLISNTEFTIHPVCLASSQFQQSKLSALESQTLSNEERQKARAQIEEKVCLCDHLGNGALIALGLTNGHPMPQAICPGPNIAWFDRIYTLKEMVDHIYGRGESLVSDGRPHMFAKEIVMSVDYFEILVRQCRYSAREIKTLSEYYENLVSGMDFCLALASRTPFKGENLASIPPCVDEQKKRLQGLYGRFEELTGACPVALTGEKV
jgi:hypothetical protein